MLVELQRREDLDNLIEKSRTYPVLIFKHSTQCPVSDAAYEEFLAFTETASDVESGVVLVIENRRLSDAIESQFGVRHESPQAIVVRNGRQTWNASHWSITVDALNKALRG
jgi:bacillithiol system protein YtxJ